MIQKHDSLFTALLEINTIINKTLSNHFFSAGFVCHLLKMFRSCYWTIGVLGGCFLFYRMFGRRTKQIDFGPKIAAKQKARIINRKNLEAALRVDGQVHFQHLRNCSLVRAIIS
jgi:hypothetical protein